MTTPHQSRVQVLFSSSANANWPHGQRVAGGVRPSTQTLRNLHSGNLSSYGTALQPIVGRDISASLHTINRTPGQTGENYGYQPYSLKNVVGLPHLERMGMHIGSELSDTDLVRPGGHLVDGVLVRQDQGDNPVDSESSASFTWSTSNAYGVCFYHPNRRGSIACSLSNRNFCSPECFRLGFQNVRIAIMNGRKTIGTIANDNLCTYNSIGSPLVFDRRRVPSGLTGVARGSRIAASLESLWAPRALWKLFIQIRLSGLSLAPTMRPFCFTGHRDALLKIADAVEGHRKRLELWRNADNSVSDFSDSGKCGQPRTTDPLYGMTSFRPGGGEIGREIKYSLTFAPVNETDNGGGVDFIGQKGTEFSMLHQGGLHGRPNFNIDTEQCKDGLPNSNNVFQFTEAQFLRSRAEKGRESLRISLLADHQIDIRAVRADLERGIDVDPVVRQIATSGFWDDDQTQDVRSDNTRTGGETYSYITELVIPGSRVLTSRLGDVGEGSSARMDAALTAARDVTRAPQGVYKSMSELTSHGTDVLRDSSGPVWHNGEMLLCDKKVSSNDGEISVMTWNVLCDIFATESMFPNTTPAYLTWEYRKDYILDLLLCYEPDVICLQEVHSKHYLQHFQPKLLELGFGGFFKEKPFRGYGKQEDAVTDGCAVFYNLATVSPVAFSAANYFILVQAFQGDVGFLGNRREAKDARVNKNNIALQVLFELNPILARQDQEEMVARKTAYSNYIKIFEENKKRTKVKATAPGGSAFMRDGPSPSDTGEIVWFRQLDASNKNQKWGDLVIVATTHVLANPESSDVKFIQTALLLYLAQRFINDVREKAERIKGRGNAGGKVKSLRKHSLKPRVGLVVSGDFNSVPGSAVYNYVTEGCLDPNHPEFSLNEKPLMAVAKSCALSHPDGFSSQPSRWKWNHDLNLVSANAILGLAIDRDLHLQLNNCPALWQPTVDRKRWKPLTRKLGEYEPLWTNSTPKFADTLDYIFCGTDDLLCTKSLKIPVHDIIGEVDHKSTLSACLPSRDRPSDHLPVMSVFAFREDDGGYIRSGIVGFIQGLKNRKTPKVQKVILKKDGHSQL